MLPSDAQERKKYPLYTGLLKYFPRALAAVANVSYVGNEQHNPGTPVHWDRAKSQDQEDCFLRHLMDDLTEEMDKDNVMHLSKAAWRVLAALEIRLERKEAKNGGIPK